MSTILNIQKDITIDWLPTPVTTISKDNKVIYYFIDKPLEITEKDDLILLYDENKHPLWRLTHKDWDGITLQYIDTIVHISPQLNFQLNQKDYHWQIITMDTNSSCYCQQQLIAEFQTNQITILQEHDLIVSSFLCLSGLLLLKSPYPPQRSPTTLTEEDDDVTSLSRYYPGHHHLVQSRWSSHSNKSIELDPGFWHCYWGYGCWWSWFPCCMPGGILDRAMIKLKGGYPPTSRQGYKQEYY